MYCIPVLIYGYFASTVGGVDWETQICYVRSGVWRAFAGLCIGGGIYKVAKILSGRKIHRLKKIVISYIEVSCYVYAVLVAWKYTEIDNSTFIIIIFLAIGLTLTFSKISYWSKADYSIFSKLGSFATPLYICHYSVGRLINQLMGERNCDIKWRYIIYYSISFLTAIIMMQINKLLGKNKNG